MLALVFLLVGCGETVGESMDASRATSVSTEPVAHTLQLITEGGMPIADVRVDVYADSRCSDRIWAAKTDSNGCITFKAPPSQAYVATVDSMGEGYSPRELYPLASTDETLVVDLVLPRASFEPLGLGNVIRDFTIQDVNGNTYSVSSLLQEKKAIVLNFWFENCGPCRMEFPYLQAAYEAYKDDVAVIAINPCDGDDQSVAAYAQALGLTFPVVKGDSDWIGCMSLRDYPTTVIIDRYGMICMLHKSAIVETGKFEKIFDHFVSDDYTQKTFRNLSDLP